MSDVKMPMGKSCKDLDVQVEIIQLATLDDGSENENEGGSGGSTSFYGSHVSAQTKAILIESTVEK